MTLFASDGSKNGTKSSVCNTRKLKKSTIQEDIVGGYMSGEKVEDMGPVETTDDLLKSKEYPSEKVLPSPELPTIRLSSNEGIKFKTILGESSSNGST